MKTGITISLFMLGLATMSCSSNDDDNTTDSDKKNLELKIDGLGDLGDKAHYEGWIMVEGTPVSTGTFTVDAKGAMSKTDFSLDKSKLDKATKFILTIEPTPDTDKSPSKVHILAGVFNDKSATLTIKDVAALGVNAEFSKETVKGDYILATPSNNSAASTPPPPSQEESGLWFFSKGATDNDKKSITLPTLPEGWKYEGWAVVGGKPLSTGKFKTTTGSDEDGNPYAEDKTKTPPFPGEDFLKNAPSGFTFPLDIRGGKVVISLEPDPDNSPEPFFIKPVLNAVPSTANLRAFIPLSVSDVSVTGTASIK